MKHKHPLYIIALALPLVLLVATGEGDAFWKRLELTSPRKPLFEVYRVAHAGGGIDGKTYTNSLEALDHNVQLGFRYFEIDFSYTNDGKLVCLHDWNESFRRSFGYEPERKLSLAEFNQLISRNNYLHNCTIDTLSQWMKKNADAIIITDVKEKNIQALKSIKLSLPDSERRVIPQVYQPENFSRIKNLGFRQVIWTLYKYDKDNSHAIEWAANLSHPFAITMPESRASTQLPILLKNMGIPTYVHTINDAARKKMVSLF